jgi:hypothetical protein
MDPIAKIRAKVKNCGLKTATIVEGCRQIDRNNDKIIHFDDLEMVMTEMLGKRGVELSRREWRQIMAAISNDPTRGDVLYESLYEVLDTKRDGVVEEKWFDSSTGDMEVLRTDTRGRSVSPLRDGGLVSSSGGAITPTRTRGNRRGGGVPLPRGSIGEWLQSKAYPNEVANFKCFIQALEKYERDTGEKIETTEDGFLVSLGPELKAKIQYTL